MENMENLKNQQVKTEFKANDLESKLDSLTNQLKNAFESQSEINWENGKPEKFSKNVLFTFRELNWSFDSIRVMPRLWGAH